MKKLRYTKPEITVCAVESHGLMDKVGSNTVDPIDILGKEDDFDEDDFDGDDWNGRWRRIRNNIWE